MCATNLWSINAAAFTPEFTRFTADTLGVAPAPSEVNISSGRVRNLSTAFTLTRRMCDCDTLVGRRNDSPVDGEISAQEWLTWLRELPSHVPHVSRIAVMRAWSPEDDVIAPTRACGIRIDELSEDVLRDIRDDNLLTIDYPRTAQDSQQGEKMITR
ncbi:hypothetical protein [Citricoccus muralis]|uniref:Uncharacterized protein n=1 Tax=Citricoccus muralis TaxID=169134 RepID=A0ABY8H406_9MICC|nr:hypothetical protein [Citricoccus muralis]WFP15751.1 hypothetical protein P8192_10125 [Citricoccus muralis]